MAAARQRGDMRAAGFSAMNGWHRILGGFDSPVAAEVEAALARSFASAGIATFRLGAAD